MQKRNKKCKIKLFCGLIGIENFIITVKSWELLPYVNNLATSTSNVSPEVKRKKNSCFCVCVSDGLRFH